MIVLDSCRYDLFNELYQNNELHFFQSLGEPIQAHTHSNITASSFILFFSHGIFPYPVPNGFPFKRQINLLENLKGTKVIVLGTPMIWPNHASVRSTMQAFDTVDFRRGKDICGYGVDLYNKTKRKPDLFVLWCNETHHPYEYEEGQTEWRTPEINAWNRGKPTLTEEYLKYLKKRQQEMIRYCDRTLLRLELQEPTRIILIADHGESIGEGHRIGHGNSIHPIQFTVPFQCEVMNTDLQSLRREPG